MGRGGSLTHHTIERDTFHYRWSRTHKPVLRISEGDTVKFDINDVESWQLDGSSTHSDLLRLDPSKLYPLAGPVYVEGARPGDALVVEVLEMGIDDFGWSAIMPNFGLLEEFRKPYLYKWDLSAKRFATFERGIRVPLKPFCGVLGVSPASRGFYEVGPPGRHGGNMDIKHLTAGSRVKIPVWVEGALFSAGDVHAAMGDGEVCGSAIECAGSATLRFEIEKNARLTYPQYLAGAPPRSRRGEYTATGIGPDLMEATRESVRNMLHYLEKAYHLTPEQAYVLCSVAADVRVHEVVDKPNWVVGTTIPLDLFASPP